VQVTISKKKLNVSHHIILITSYAQNVFLRYERMRVDVDATRQQHVQ